MSAYKYLGPADNVLLPGVNKVYHPGDAIPMAKAQKDAMERAGHRFEDTDLDAVALANATAVSAVTPRPHGDRGEILDIPDAHPETAVTAPVVAPSATPKSS